MASCTSRSAAARCCSASRVALVRRALISCSAAIRCCSASRREEARWSSASRHGPGAVRLDVGAGAGAALLELAQLRRAHLLDLGLCLGLDRRGVARACSRIWLACGVGLGDHLAGLLLGQAQHLAGLAAESGVRRVLVLLDLGAQRVDLALQRLEPLLGLVEARGQAGLLGRATCAPRCRRRWCRSRLAARSAASAAGGRHRPLRVAADGWSACARPRPRAASGSARTSMAGPRGSSPPVAPAARGVPRSAGPAAWRAAGPARDGPGSRSPCGPARLSAVWSVCAVSSPLSTEITWVGSSADVLGRVVEDGQALVAHGFFLWCRGSREASYDLQCHSCLDGLRRSRPRDAPTVLSAPGAMPG